MATWIMLDLQFLQLFVPKTFLIEEPPLCGLMNDKLEFMVQQRKNSTTGKCQALKLCK